MTTTNPVYSYLNNKTLTYKTEGARMLVYEIPDNPKIVLKVVASAKHLADRFAGWGIPLDQQPWAPVRGDAQVSAQRMLDNSIESFHRAHTHLNGLAAPFVILDGMKEDSPDGSVKLFEQDGSETERNFRGMVAIVQQRIQTFEEFIPAFVKAGKINDLEAIFQSLIDVTLGLWKRGIFFEVLNFHNDYGINLNGQVVVSDIGELTQDKDRAVNYIKNRKMFNEYAGKWLQGSYPVLANFYKTIVDQYLTVKNLNREWRSEADRPQNQVVFDAELLLAA